MGGRYCLRWRVISILTIKFLFFISLLSSEFQQMFYEARNISEHTYFSISYFFNMSQIQTLEESYRIIDSQIVRLASFVSQSTENYNVFEMVKALRVIQTRIENTLISFYQNLDERNRLKVVFTLPQLRDHFYISVVNRSVHHEGNPSVTQSANSFVKDRSLSPSSSLIKNSSNDFSHVRMSSPNKEEANVPEFNPPLEKIVQNKIVSSVPYVPFVKSVSFAPSVPIVTSVSLVTSVPSAQNLPIVTSVPSAQNVPLVNSEPSIPSAPIVTSVPSAQNVKPKIKTYADVVSSRVNQNDLSNSYDTKTGNNNRGNNLGSHIQFPKAHNVGAKQVMSNPNVGEKSVRITPNVGEIPVPKAPYDGGNVDSKSKVNTSQVPNMGNSINSNLSQSSLDNNRVSSKYLASFNIFLKRKNDLEFEVNNLLASAENDQTQPSSLKLRGNDLKSQLASLKLDKWIEDDRLGYFDPIELCNWEDRVGRDIASVLYKSEDLINLRKGLAQSGIKKREPPKFSGTV